MSEDPNPYRRGWRVAKSLARSDREDLATYLMNELRSRRVVGQDDRVLLGDVERALAEARP